MNTEIAPEPFVMRSFQKCACRDEKLEKPFEFKELESADICESTRVDLLAVIIVVRIKVASTRDP